MLFENLYIFLFVTKEKRLIKPKDIFDDKIKNKSKTEMILFLKFPPYIYYIYNNSNIYSFIFQCFFYFFTAKRM